MEKYKRTHVLGEGTYGKVYKAQHIETGQIVALKKTILSADDEGVPPTTLREVSILRSIESPYVVKLLDVMHSEARAGRPVLYLAFELLNHDLRQFMVNKYGKGNGIEPQLAKEFCYQVLLGLRSCHANAIMHRDLKPQNLLIDLSTQTIKLADFGLGRCFSLPVNKYTHEVVTLWYRAPEILLGTKYYSPAVDIWSVGCILAEMIIGRAMFCGESEIEQLFAIFEILGTPTHETWPEVKTLRDWHEYPAWRPKDLKSLHPDLMRLGSHGLELLQNMLHLDPQKRITVVDALMSPYFDDIRQNFHQGLDDQENQMINDNI